MTRDRPLSPGGERQEEEEPRAHGIQEVGFPRQVGFAKCRKCGTAFTIRGFVHLFAALKAATPP